MTITDKAGNTQQYDFTEIVRFEIDDTPSSFNKTAINQDGTVNTLDLVTVAQAFDKSYCLHLSTPYGILILLINEYKTSQI